MFLTTPEFLPQHRAQQQAALQIITTAEAAGQARLAEMNKQVAGNLGKIITALETDARGRKRPPVRPEPPPRSPPPRPAATSSPAPGPSRRSANSTGRPPVTFASVAAAAGISRSWLYTQPDIRGQISRCATPRQHPRGRDPGPAARDRRVAAQPAHRRARTQPQLTEENARLDASSHTHSATSAQPRPIR